MISKRELVDDKTTISTTRWAYVSIVTFAIVSVVLVLVSYVVCSLVDKPLPEGFLGGAAALIAIPMGIITTSKALQGFEPHKDKPTVTEEKEKLNDNNGK